LSLSDSYDYFTGYADEIEKLTNGKINFFRTISVHDTALDFFHSTTGNKIDVEHIEQDEAIWIDKCATGAVIHSKNNYDRPAYKYDFISHYPSIMADPHTSFPIKRGQFTQITTEEFSQAKYLKIGRYRFMVTTTHTLFRPNKYNYYTQIELN
jgi:hypothetical protein